MMPRFLALLAGLVIVPGVTARAQSPDDNATRGAAVYATACAACHAPDGRGHPQDRVGFDTPLPDFTDCAFNTPENAADWSQVARLGGPARAFDRRMPAFGEALSSEEIDLAVAHLRAFCTDPRWPRGELNLPRPLVTEKAFPENEAVLDLAIDAGASRGVRQQVVYERRLGARSQYEVVVPFDMQRGDDGWRYGLGDVALALKSAVVHSERRGSILSVGTELKLPTGKEDRGLGNGQTIIEPFVAYGQILGGSSFVHLQGGFERAIGRSRPTEAFLRAAAGTTLLQGRYGRSWSPMIEVLGARELPRRERAQWDVVPQMQVSLSRRQHILVSVGVRVPVNQRDGRSPQMLSYFLWDWFDGGLFDGWR